MKKLSVLLTILSLLMITHGAIAQNSVTDHSVINKSNDLVLNDLKFECKQSMTSLDTKQITLQDNVAIKTDKFECKDASKAIFDQTCKKLTVYNCKSFSFHGEIVMSIDKKIENIIEYTLGDNKLFIN